MRASEKQCRKFKQTHIEWSPEVGIWICRRRILERIGRLLDGKVPDARNLVRACSSKGISDPRSMTRKQIQTELFICHKKVEELKPKAPQLRHAHLKRRLAAAKAAANEKAVSSIQRIMSREAKRKRWARMKSTTKPRHGE